MKPPEKNTERFTRTVEHYTKFRPSYPKALIDFLFENKYINLHSVVADIGSGTGIFTELLLKTGSKVFAVEPNQAMRKIAEKNLKHFKNFHSINGTAENTTLQDANIDAISVATAFHWFDFQACQEEFKRILKPNGWVMLLWNIRLPNTSPLSHDYDILLKKYCSEYKGAPAEKITEKIFLQFFAKKSAKIVKFSNQQQLDLHGLIGRLRSTSYALTPEQPNYDAMISALTDLFSKHQNNNFITLSYVTKLYIGKLP